MRNIFEKFNKKKNASLENQEEIEFKLLPENVKEEFERISSHQSTHLDTGVSSPGNVIKKDLGNGRIEYEISCITTIKLSKDKNEMKYDSEDNMYSQLHRLQHTKVSEEGDEFKNREKVFIIETENGEIV